jgi:hypothetical protein
MILLRCRRGETSAHASLAFQGLATKMAQSRSIEAAILSGCIVIEELLIPEKRLCEGRAGG